MVESNDLEMLMARMLDEIDPEFEWRKCGDFDTKGMLLGMMILLIAHSEWQQHIDTFVMRCTQAQRELLRKRIVKEAQSIFEVRSNKPRKNRGDREGIWLLYQMLFSIAEIEIPDMFAYLNTLLHEEFPHESNIH
jgi:hypothetical protein